MPSGVGLSTVALAAVFGLLSFAGFEGAASLSEETDNPRRDIPRAIATAVITMGVFYTIVMLAQTLGFPRRWASSRGVTSGPSWPTP
ncbi:MAG: amino acid permease [Rubrobacter sp.]